MWRVSYCVRGGRDDWHVFDDVVEAWEFASGVLLADRHDLLVRLCVEEAVGDDWIARHDLLA